jgi:hypothetical protein
MWKWTPIRNFSVKSVYEHLTKDENGHAYKVIWKEKILERSRSLCGKLLKKLF